MPPTKLEHKNLEDLKEEVCKKEKRPTIELIADLFETIILLTVTAVSKVAGLADIPSVLALAANFLFFTRLTFSTTKTLSHWTEGCPRCGIEASACGAPTRPRRLKEAVDKHNA